MRAGAADGLSDFRPRHGYFVGVDSDGCVFPTMAAKQKECFHPAIMDHWSLWGIEREVRRAAEWVNLESAWRGGNRFRSLKMVFDLLREMPAVRASGAGIRDTADLGAFIDSGLALDEAALADYVAVRPGLLDVLAWSRDVNCRVEAKVGALPPFAHARPALEQLRARADIVVVSATPVEALEREWRAQGLDRLVDLVAGQEAGEKAFQLAAAAGGGRYPPGRVLMIGDAPGDLRAARAVGALFYPVCPGREEESWALLRREAAGLFFAGAYAGDYEARLVSDFSARLPEKPGFPWCRSGPC